MDAPPKMLSPLPRMVVCWGWGLSRPEAWAWPVDCVTCFGGRVVEAKLPAVPVPNTDLSFGFEALFFCIS